MSARGEATEGGAWPELEALARAYEAWGRFVATSPRILRARDEVRPLLGSTPASTVYREHTLALRRYEPPRRVGARARAVRPAPVLLVPSLVNGAYILDLLPGESLVEHLLARGLDVFLLDWGAPNPGQSRLTLGFYLHHYLERVVGRVLSITGARRCHLVGYCLGGTMAAMWLATRPDPPVASFVALTTPVNFVDEGILSWWARPGHIDVDRLVDAFGNVPEQFFRATFPWIVPTASLRKLRTLFERHGDEEFMRSFLALDIWLTENLPFPGEVYRQVIKDLYQENLLVGDRMVVDGRPARLGAIRVPLLNVVARHDHVAPAASCTVLSEKVSSSPSRLEVIEAGHLGPALGRDARGLRTMAYWETISHWLMATEGSR